MEELIAAQEALRHADVAKQGFLNTPDSDAERLTEAYNAYKQALTDAANAQDALAIPQSDQPAPADESPGN